MNLGYVLLIFPITLVIISLIWIYLILTNEI